MKSKKYRVYAGYYEMWITDRILGRPLCCMSTHRSLTNALRAARRYDPDAWICVDTTIKDEYCELEGLEPEQVEASVFDGGQYDPSLMLTDITKYCLSRKFDTRMTLQDLHDIAHFLAARLGTSFKTIAKRYRESTYADINPVVAPYIDLSNVSL